MTLKRGRGMSNIVRALCALVTAAVGTVVAPAVAFAVCLPVAQAPARFMPASFGPRSAQADVQVRLTFVGHASFLIESPSGVRAVTDYSGVHRPPAVPDIVTMNNAHTMTKRFSRRREIASTKPTILAMIIGRHEIVLKNSAMYSTTA